MMGATSFAYVTCCATAEVATPRSVVAMVAVRMAPPRIWRLSPAGRSTRFMIRFLSHSGARPPGPHLLPLSARCARHRDLDLNIRPAAVIPEVACRLSRPVVNNREQEVLTRRAEVRRDRRLAVDER